MEGWRKMYVRAREYLSRGDPILIDTCYVALPAPLDLANGQALGNLPKGMYGWVNVNSEVEPSGDIIFVAVDPLTGKRIR